MFKMKFGKNGKKHSQATLLKEKLSESVKFAEDQSEMLKNYFKKNKNFISLKNKNLKTPLKIIIAAFGVVLLSLGAVAAIMKMKKS